MPHWVGAQGQGKVGQKRENIPHYDVPPENPKPKMKKCLI